MNSTPPSYQSKTEDKLKGFEQKTRFSFLACARVQTQNENENENDEDHVIIIKVHRA
jgi:hypothetical protein